MFQVIVDMFLKMEYSLHHLSVAKAAVMQVMQCMTKNFPTNVKKSVQYNCLQ